MAVGKGSMARASKAAGTKEKPAVKEKEVKAVEKEAAADAERAMAD